MNVVVRAKSLTANSEAVNATVFVQFNIVSSHAPAVFWLRPSTTIISVNGHSISAVAPDFAEGRETTLIAA